MASRHDYTKSFPREIARKGVWFLRVSSAIPQHKSGVYRVKVNGEQILVPLRIYTSETVLRTLGVLTPELADCLLTRHHDGFVRSRALSRVLKLDHIWAAPFVVQLMGEYVVEILQQIEASFDEINPVHLRAFIDENPDFIFLTRQRVASYWNCYWRHIDRRSYVGFRLLRRLEQVAKA